MSHVRRGGLFVPPLIQTENAEKHGEGNTGGRRTGRETREDNNTSHRRPFPRCIRRRGDEERVEEVEEMEEGVMVDVVSQCVPHDRARF